MRVIKNILFSLFPLTVLLLLLEGVARLAGYPETQAPSEELREIYKTTINKPSKTDTSTNNSNKKQLNLYGFRGREFNFHPDTAKTYTIIILGGSVATGAWAGQLDNTPAAYLEKNLKEFIQTKYQKELVVYSLAESSSDIEDEAFWLLKLGIALKPNLVLSITGFNNMTNATNKNWEKSSGGRAFKRMGIIHGIDEVNEGISINAQRLSRSLYLFSAKYSYLMVWLNHLLFAAEHEQEVKEKMQKLQKIEQKIMKNRLDFVASLAKPDTMPILQAQRFKQTAMQIDKICKTNNITYFVVLQPFRDCGKNLVQNLLSDGSQDNRNQFLYRTLLQEWNKKPIATMPYLETSELVGDELQENKSFGDDCHLWDNGFVILNQSIVEWLKKSL